MKASVFVGVSLDGFIARENGDLDWLDGDAQEGNEEHGYEAFISTVDVLVMGRNTFETVLSFGTWPYGAKPVVVLTSRPLRMPKRIPKTVEVMEGSPDEVLNKLSKRGMKHAYVDGGKTIQAFLNDGLIQRLILTRLPVLIGTGIALFGPLSQDIKLRHISTKVFANGLVQSEYAVLPPKRRARRVAST